MKKTFLLFISFILFIASCKVKEEFYQIVGETQGTTFSVIYEGKHDNLKIEIDSLLRDFDMSLSTYIPESIISKINRGIEVKVDDYFITMFEKAKEVTNVSGGAFDITVGPLINAYGFGYEEAETHIDSALIDSLLDFVGMEKIKLVNNVLVKSDDRIKISGNAIAQGQSVDVIADFLSRKGIENYMVEIGGELKVKGLKYGRKWRVGIDKPIEGNDIAGQNLQTILEITDYALATSGNYRKFYIKDGIKYAHSIDPNTGYPAYKNLLSATILASDCISADAFATACMVSGLEKSIEMVENDPDLEAYFVYADKDSGELKVYYTKALEAMIVEP